MGKIVGVDGKLPTPEMLVDAGIRRKDFAKIARYKHYIFEWIYQHELGERVAIYRKILQECGEHFEDAVWQYACKEGYIPICYTDLKTLLMVIERHGYSAVFNRDELDRMHHLNPQKCRLRNGIFKSDVYPENTRIFSREPLIDEQFKDWPRADIWMAIAVLVCQPNILIEGSWTMFSGTEFRHDGLTAVPMIRFENENKKPSMDNLRTAEMNNYQIVQFYSVRLMFGDTHVE